MNRVRSEETLGKCLAYRNAKAGQTTVPLYLEEAAAMWPTPMAGTPAQKGNNAAGNSDFSRRTMELAETWATPNAHDGHRPGADVTSTQRRNLNREAANWPTPSVMLTGERTSPEAFAQRQARLKEKHRGRTGNVAKQWPTPAAQNWKGSSEGSIIRKDGKSRMSILCYAAEQNFPHTPPAPAIPAGQTSSPHILTLFQRHRLTTDSASRSALRALLLMGIRSRAGKRIKGLRRPLHPGWTRRAPCAPYVRPSFRRRLNPIFVEWLMGWPTGLSGFARAETGFFPWLRRMRICLSALHSQRTAPGGQETLL